MWDKDDDGIAKGRDGKASQHTHQRIPEQKKAIYIYTHTHTHTHVLLSCFLAQELSDIHTYRFLAQEFSDIYIYREREVKLKEI